MEKSKFEKEQIVFDTIKQKKCKVINCAYLHHLEMFYYLIEDEEGKLIFAYETELKEIR